MLVIVKSEDQNKLSNLLGYDPIIYSFKEIFFKYLFVECLNINLIDFIN